MATPDEVVRDGLWFYPSLFRTRGDVLHHVLCVIGSGYEWENGEVVSAFPGYQDEDPVRREIDGFQEECRGGRSRSSYVSDGILGMHADALEVALLTHAQIDARVQRMALTHGQKPYDSSRYALLRNVPDDVTPEWARACEQMWALVEGRAGWSRDGSPTPDQLPTPPQPALVEPSWRALLEQVVQDYGSTCCDHLEDCACSMARAFRALEEA